MKPAGVLQQLCAAEVAEDDDSVRWSDLWSRDLSISDVCKLFTVGSAAGEMTVSVSHCLCSLQL